MQLNGFSPVAGILLVESRFKRRTIAILSCFSPVAGILLVERSWITTHISSTYCFSPVAGILLVESIQKGLELQNFSKFQSRCRDSIS